MRPGAIPDGADGYCVYRYDIGGGDQMPTITDGTDQEVIDAVERDCEFVAFVERRRTHILWHKGHNCSAGTFQKQPNPHPIR